jgi:hypothetical protein
MEPKSKGVIQFNFTNSKIKKDEETLAIDTNKVNVKLKLNEEISIQKEREKNLLEKYLSCPNENVIKIVKNLSDIEFNKLKNVMNNSSYYNGNLMKAISEIFQAIFYKDNKISISNKLAQKYDKLYLSKPLSPNERGREYIKDLNEFKSSIYGVTLTETLKNTKSDAKNLFIIKISKKPKYNDDIIHECIVGFYGTNKLRDVGIPNFAYVVGAFSGSGPFYNDKKVISFIDSMKNPINYVIYENISPAITLDEYCKTCSAEDFLLYYCQIIYALLYANKEIGFTHYDAHTNNILMRIVHKQPFYIAYPDLEDEDKKRYFLSNGMIPTFIDYGMSHITIDKEIPGVLQKNIDKENFGALNNLITSGYPIFRDRPFFFYDAYKILMSSLKCMKIHNVNSYKELKPLLFLFFGKISDDELEKIFKDKYFNLPYTQATSGLDEKQWEKFTEKYNIIKPFNANDTNYITPKDYFELIVKFYNSKFGEYEKVYTYSEEEAEKYNLLSCNGSCLTVQEDLEDLNALSINNVVYTFEEFYDVYGLLYEQSYQPISELSKLINEHPSVDRLNKLYDNKEAYRSLLKEYPTNKSFKDKFEKSVNEYSEYEISSSLKAKYLKLKSEIEKIENKINHFIKDFIPRFSNAFDIEEKYLIDLYNEFNNKISYTYLFSNLRDIKNGIISNHFKNFIQDLVIYLTSFNNLYLHISMLITIIKVLYGHISNENYSKLNKMYLFYSKYINSSIPGIDYLYAYIDMVIIKMEPNEDVDIKAFKKLLSSVKNEIFEKTKELASLLL